MLLGYEGSSVALALNAELFLGAITRGLTTVTSRTGAAFHTFYFSLAKPLGSKPITHGNFDCIEGASSTGE